MHINLILVVPYLKSGDLHTHIILYGLHKCELTISTTFDDMHSLLPSGMRENALSNRNAFNTNDEEI